MSKLIDTLDSIKSRYTIVDKNGCWVWKKSTKDVYPDIRRNGKNIRLHRYMWQLIHGSTNGLFVLHKCDNTKCCNPDHLFLGTQKDNVRDMFNKNRNHKRIWSENDRMLISKMFKGVKHSDERRLLHNIGENNSNSKLTQSQVNEIKTSSKTVIQLSKEYNISRSAIYRIKRNESWVTTIIQN